MSVVQDKDSSGWSDLEASEDTVDMGCQLCRTDSSGWSDLEARKGKVDMGCQSCRTGTVQAGVTWRPGKVKWTWGVSRAGQGQFRLE